MDNLPPYRVLNSDFPDLSYIHKLCAIVLGACSPYLSLLYSYFISTGDYLARTYPTTASTMFCFLAKKTELLMIVLFLDNTPDQIKLLKSCSRGRIFVHVMLDMINGFLDAACCASGSQIVPVKLSPTYAETIATGEMMCSLYGISPKVDHAKVNVEDVGEISNIVYESAVILETSYIFLNAPIQHKEFTIDLNSERRHRHSKKIEAELQRHRREEQHATVSGH